MIVPAPRYWQYPLDLSKTARNWTQDPTGAQRRLNNSADALRALADKINHLASRQGRVIFAQGWREGLEDQRGAAPLAAVVFGDWVGNAKRRTATLLCLPRIVAATESSTAVLESCHGEGTANFPATLATTPGPRWPEDLFICSIRQLRDAATGNWLEDTLTTLDGFTIDDVSIQEDALSTLDTDIDEMARPADASAGAEVLVGALGDCRAAFHGFRRDNLGVEICWSACGTDEGWANETVPVSTITVPMQAPLGAGGDQRGMWITSATLVNLLDTSVVARSATSPGISCLAYRAGIGAEYLDVGASVPLAVDVFGYSVGSGPATVRFQGPDHVANNYVDVLVPVGTSPARCHGTTNLLLNANATDADETTARNKVDIFGRVAGAGDDLFIYGLHGERCWAAVA